MGAEHFFAQFILPGAATVGFPLEMGVTNLTERGKIWQFSQRSSQHCFIARAIVRPTEGAAHGVIDENSTGWRDFAHNIERRSDHYGRDSATFDDVGDETDGLMAEGSVGYQKRQINLRAL